MIFINTDMGVIEGYIPVKGAVAYADPYPVPLNDVSVEIARKIAYTAFQKQGIDLDLTASLSFVERGEDIEIKVLEAE